MAALKCTQSTTLQLPAGACVAVVQIAAVKHASVLTYNKQILYILSSIIVLFIVPLKILITGRGT